MKLKIFIFAAALMLAAFVQAQQTQSAVVTANPLWVDTGISLTNGEIASITATGSWTYAQPEGVPFYGPDGNPAEQGAGALADLFYLGAPVGSLIAYVGSDPYQGHWGDASFFPQTTGYWDIGSSNQIISPQLGELWLGYNDDSTLGYYALIDNAGSVTAQITTSSPAIPPTVTIGSGSVALSTNGFNLTVNGPIGSPYVLSASSDLIVWWPILYLTSTNSPFVFNDSEAAHYTQRYYKVGILPPLNGNVPPYISSPPQSQESSAGTTVTFNVTASGTAPLTYQWYKNGSQMSDGGNVSGANTSTLTLSDLSCSDAGGYFVVVSNPVGPNASSIATLEVPLDVFANQPNLNWSGYAVESVEIGTYDSVTDVKGTWKVPTVSSSDPSGVFATWIGIGGLKDVNLVQIGIKYDSSQAPPYQAFYESYSSGCSGVFSSCSVPINSVPINAGDTISAEVRSLGNGQYQATIVNVTQNVPSPTESMSSPNNTAETAEWIIEDPSDTTILGTKLYPLADFDIQKFSGCSVTFNNNSKPQSITSDCRANITPLILENSDGTIIYEQPEPLSPDGTSFSVEYVNSPSN